jgi:hypothetical protein
MHQTGLLLTSLAVAVASACFVGGSVGCSSSSGTDGSSSSSSSSGSSSGSSSMVSFSNDVMPIFKQGCTLTQDCHGQMGNAAEANLYLGDSVMNTSTTIMNAYMNIVSQPAVENASFQLVKPSDHKNSYLYMKISDMQSDLDALACTSCTICAGGPCGVPMPFGNLPLTSDQQSTIANWIDQGAQNN